MYRNHTTEIIIAVVCSVLLCILAGVGDSGVSRLFAISMPAVKTTMSPTDEYTFKFIKKEKEEAASQASDTVLPLRATYSDKPTILIYHTHTLEAYTATEKYPYTEHGGRWRTDDNTRNVVAVGEVLKSELEKYGFNVLHDITDHEPPKLSTAYERSLKTMLKYKAEYPSLEMYIDLHRDACGEDNTGDYCVIDGVKTARIMFVVGTGKGATGTGYGEMPDFDKNYALAEKLTEYLRNTDEGLAREIRVKKGRYNQHVADKCLLAEIGHNMNTLEEAKNAAKLLAKAIAGIAADRL